MVKVKSIVFLIFVILSPLRQSLALDDIRLRARENYEIIDMEFQGQTQQFQGLSNTFNLWFERPFDISYGLAGGSIFSGFSPDGQNQIPGLSNEIKVDFLGFEVKWFLYSQGNQGLFFRPGIYWQNLKSRGRAGKIQGSAYYLGMGYEFLIYKQLSLSPEIAVKRGEAQDYSWQAVVVSVGLHFYRF